MNQPKRTWQKNDAIAVIVCLVISAATVLRILRDRGTVQENLAVGAGALVMAFLIAAVAWRRHRLHDAPVLRLPTWRGPSLGTTQRTTLFLAAGTALSIAGAFIGVRQHLASPLVLTIALAGPVLTIAAIAFLAPLLRTGYVVIDAEQLRFEPTTSDAEPVSIWLAQGFAMEIFVEPRQMTWANVLLHVTQHETELWLWFTVEYAQLNASLRNHPRPGEMRGQFIGGAPAGFEVLRRLAAHKR